MSVAYGPQPTPGSGITCPNCGSHNVAVQAVTETETRHRGCFRWLLWLVLAVITLGLILLIPLLTNSKTRSHTRTVAVCQNCGHRWDVA
jgi:hypothetical protein